MADKGKNGPKQPRVEEARGAHVDTPAETIARLSEVDLAIIEAFARITTAQVHLGKNGDAIEILRMAAHFLRQRYVMPAPLASFLAARFDAMVEKGPWRERLLIRTATQARMDGHVPDRSRRDATYQAYLKIKAAPRGTKTKVAEDEAEALGIDGPALRKRIREYGF